MEARSGYMQYDAGERHSLPPVYDSKRFPPQMLVICYTEMQTTTDSGLKPECTVPHL